MTTTAIRSGAPIQGPPGPTAALTGTWGTRPNAAAGGPRRRAGTHGIKRMERAVKTFTYTFDGPRVRVTKNLPCPTCGKKVRRQRTFQHTVNPFNKRAGGAPKTWDEVYEDVQAEAAEWRATPERHAECEVTP